MSLRETVAGDARSPGGSCPVRVLIGGGVPQGSDTTVALEPDDREFLAEACAPGSPAVLARVHRALVAEGYRVGATALQAHRRRDCTCDRRP